ncbi:hypothetical protein CNMCM6106_003300 [Aspergillus hiratsukae]|uniref:Uncharacterized protein n=1 Tax=Aspergillus hiratsukae TaxID=1194566 RepID=A0A8H6Q7M5_9EURO|nr:hypothetical protein CNMCM6106_003300 [Aspergillus hiratsukae]
MMSYTGVLALLTCLATASPTAQFPDNANHIFNAIHSSMRQWGSSLHHNGMSFFLASVPAGTQLYHGTGQSDPVNGTEWLAFEPEHAMFFARMFRDGPGPPPGGPDGPGSDSPRGSAFQKPLGLIGETENDADAGGWLHTYAAAKDLRLVYIDGMSAAKSSNGTLDSQDRILLRDVLDDGKGGGMIDELRRAKTICRMAREEWENRIDGVIRMEAGFEIILCDFARDLDLLHVVQVKLDGNGPGGLAAAPGREPGRGKDKGKGPGGPGGANRWLKAIAARYHGIGGHRVALNYDHFVTVYTYGLDLFASAEGRRSLPRLQHLSSADLDPIRMDLHRLIMTHDANESSFDWQAVTDMVIERYAHELRYLASGELATTEQLHAELEIVLSPFIDYSDRNTTLEADRCTAQFLPARSPTKGVAAQAVRSVARTSCSTLLEAWGQTDYGLAVKRIDDLMEYLSWTTWKECRGCGDHEICVVPIWPMGTVEDYEHPQCRDANQPYGEGSSYWGGTWPR